MKITDVCRIHPMKFAKIRFPCGDLRTRCGGMTGLFAFVSTWRKVGKAMRNTMRETIINGCDPFHCQR